MKSFRHFLVRFIHLIFALSLVSMVPVEKAFSIMEDPCVEEPCAIEEGYSGAWGARDGDKIGQSFRVLQTCSLISVTMRLSGNDVEASGIFDVNVYEFSETTAETGARLASVPVDVDSLPIRLQNIPPSYFFFPGADVTLSPEKSYLLTIEPRFGFLGTVYSQSATDIYSCGHFYYNEGQGWQSYRGQEGGDMEFCINAEIEFPSTCQADYDGDGVVDFRDWIKKKEDMNREFLRWTRECWSPGVETLEVPIDIKPFYGHNNIYSHPRKHPERFTKVAILSTENFNAPDQINRKSLTFGRTGDEQSLIFCLKGGRDMNGDGLPDLRCHFRNNKMDFQCGDDQGFLKGALMDDTPIQGSDFVRIVPCSD